jgi:hypothetical protein
LRRPRHWRRVLGLVELDLDLVAAGLLGEGQACRAWVLG